MIETPDKDVFLGARAVKKRYGGKSDMAIHRWLQDHSLGFPKPIYIQGYRYWKLADLIAWEKNLPTKEGGNG